MEQWNAVSGIFGDLKNPHRVIASGFYCLSAVCVFIIAVTVAIAGYVPKFFAIHSKFVSAVVTLFRWLARFSAQHASTSCMASASSANCSAPG
jgi:putative exporter of polyketide antibiotics